MPIYTYRCNDCGHEFELRQRMMDDPLTECPECEGYIRRVVNSVGVVFKGSGFYITDNRGGNNSASAPANKSETKAENKPKAAPATSKSDNSSTAVSSTA
ncbi:MAG: zinc ribbon domain-containing protein [Candidatus Promineifilaceae bacterium]